MLKGGGVGKGFIKESRTLKVNHAEKAPLRWRLNAAFPSGLASKCLKSSKLHWRKTNNNKDCFRTLGSFKYSLSWAKGTSKQKSRGNEEKGKVLVIKNSTGGEHDVSPFLEVCSYRHSQNASPECYTPAKPFTHSVCELGGGVPLGEILPTGWSSAPSLKYRVETAAGERNGMVQSGVSRNSWHLEPFSSRFPVVRKFTAF